MTLALRCSAGVGVLSIGRASHVAFARGLHLAVKQFSKTAFALCARLHVNFYRLANECNGRIFMHFLSDAALVEVPVLLTPPNKTKPPETQQITSRTLQERPHQP